jgi:pimeloyl-ACP methyl ester carboxylesterase
MRLKRLGKSGAAANTNSTDKIEEKRMIWLRFQKATSVLRKASGFRGMGHFAAWEQPQLFSEEVRAGFRSLRRSFLGEDTGRA